MRRVRDLASVALIALPLVFALAPEAAAAPGKCDVAFADPVCEVGKTVIDKAGDVAAAPVSYAAGSAVDAMTSWVADTAQWILGRVVTFIDNSTSPTLDAGWFTERYRFMVGLGALILVPMLLAATIRAVITQDLSQLARSFFVYLPAAILGTLAAVTITQALLAATDSLSAEVGQSIAGDASEIFDSVGSALSKSVGVTNPSMPSFAVFFAALLLIVGSFFVWLELLIRSAAVTVAMFFLPMILAGLVWPAAMRWTKRLIEILVALILSKFVVVAVISLATAALADPGGGGFGTVMGGAALMLMAAFSPFALLKLMPMVEGAAIEHLGGMGRRPMETVRPEGGVHQAISLMRSKTRGGGAPGLAVAGGAGAVAAGSAAVATTAAGATKTVAKAPGSRVQRQADSSKSASADDSPTKKPDAGGGIAPTASSPTKKGPEKQ